jgi:hypothetical protein
VTVLVEFRNPPQFVLMTSTSPQKAVSAPMAKSKDPQSYVLSQTVYEFFQITIPIIHRRRLEFRKSIKSDTSRVSLGRYR